MSDSRQIQARCEAYIRQQWARAGALSPGERREVVRELQRDLHERGRVPFGDGGHAVYVDPTLPMIQAALAGQPVTRGGEVIAPAGAGGLHERMVALPMAGKVAALLAIFLVPVGLLGAVLLAERPGSIAAATATVAAPLAAAPTATPGPSATPSPSPTIGPSATPHSLALTTGQLSAGGSDPASIEIGGRSYVLGASEVVAGLWEPEGASWLRGSTLRRVVALPWEPALANAVATLPPGAVLRLRLRSGEIARYRLDETVRVQRTQIELLAGRSPSLVVLLSGEASAERTVLVASALQEPPAAPLQVAAPPTPGPETVTLVVAEARTVTNEAAGLALTVGDCRGATRLGSARPPEGRRFYLCEITLRARRDGVAYSDQAIRIGERAALESSIGWLPEAVAAPGALGAGTLDRDGVATGAVGGVVLQGGLGAASSPMLVWELAGTRFLVPLDLKEEAEP